jgi:RanBP-type and C3HC4-type zinc finger-containing protein 1
LQLVSDGVFERHLQLSSREAESQAGEGSYHCVTPDCRGWCLYDPQPPEPINGKIVIPRRWYEFWCPVCSKPNCMQCRAIHPGEDCQQYQQRLKEKASNDKNAELAMKELEVALSQNDFTLMCLKLILCVYIKSQKIPFIKCRFNAQE